MKKIILVDIILAVLILGIVFAIKPPEKVQGLAVDGTTYNTASLSWDKTDKASGYYVYRSEDNENYDYVGSTKETSFEDTGLETGKTYTYIVRPHNGVKKAKKSEEVEATPNLSIPEVNGNVDKGKVELSITTVEGAQGYKIYRDDEEIDCINLAAETIEPEPKPVEEPKPTFEYNYHSEKDGIVDITPVAEEEEEEPEEIDVEETTYVDDSAEVNKDYKYEVKAFRNEAESDSCKPVPLELVSAGDINTRIRGDELILSWDNDEYNSYKLYNNDELIAETEATEFSMPADTTKYDFKLVGYNEDKQSPASVKKIEITEEPMDNKTAIQNAIDWALDIAADDSFTYGKKPTTNRVGCYFCGTNQRNKPKGYEKTYVCMTFVTAAYAHGAKDPEVYSVCSKGKMCLSLTDTNFTRFTCWKKVGRCRNLSVSDLEPGDVIVWYDPHNSNDGHMSMYIGDGNIVDASGGGWDAGSISVKYGKASRYLNYRGNSHSSQNYVMRYTGNGSGTMKVINEIKD